MTGGAGSERRAATRPDVGDVLGGKYRLERLIGEGGMGKVYAARHEELGELFAVKVLEESSARDAQRVLREARATMRLKNEHVVRVIDASAGETHPFMVMELLEGEDLDALVMRTGPLPVQAAVDYVLQACEALAEAHAIGMVHRDVKPANLLLTQHADGRPLVKVLDFGIVKDALGRDDGRGPKTSVTEVGAVFGSPAYMSPEQLRSTKDVDVRTDVWSLGVVLYELLTGRLPFAGESRVALSIAVATSPFLPMRQLRPELPPELDVIVGACLQKALPHRTSSVAELAARLRPFASESGAASCEVVARLAAVRASLVSVPNPVASVVASAASAPAPPLGFTRTGVVTLREPPPYPRWVPAVAACAALLGVALLVGSLAFVRQPKAGAEVTSGANGSSGSREARTSELAASQPPPAATSVPPLAEATVEATNAASSSSAVAFEVPDGTPSRPATTARNGAALAPSATLTPTSTHRPATRTAPNDPRLDKRH